MPALLPIILTASHVLVADTVPKFSVERTCRPAAVVSILPGRDASACQRDENDARTKLERDWTQYSAAQHSGLSARALSRSTVRRTTSNC
jgi:hypothetical protein